MRWDSALAGVLEISATRGEEAGKLKSNWNSPEPVHGLSFISNSFKVSTEGRVLAATLNLSLLPRSLRRMCSSTGSYRGLFLFGWPLLLLLLPNYSDLLSSHWYANGFAKVLCNSFNASDNDNNRNISALSEETSNKLWPIWLNLPKSHAK